MKLLGAIPYTGNKQTLLPRLIPLFPESVGTFYDVFCGGLSVSLNVPYKVTAIDSERPLIDMYHMLMTKSNLSFVDVIISEWSLTPSDSDAYNSLRKEYNETKNPEYLYVLLMFAFNNMYRTNMKGEFNTPFGNNRFRGSRGGFKEQWYDRFSAFRRKFNADTKNVLMCANYHALDDKITSNDFVYCDPPYLITGAQYNKVWNEEREHELYAWLDTLNARGIKFGLSNVTDHNGLSNNILKQWITDNNYSCVSLDKKYKLNQIHSNEDLKTKEVYVHN